VLIVDRFFKPFSKLAQTTSTSTSWWRVCGFLQLKKHTGLNILSCVQVAQPDLQRHGVKTCEAREMLGDLAPCTPRPVNFSFKVYPYNG